jgi:hypothetical protein
MPSAMTTVAATEPITSTMSRTVLAVRNVNKIVLVVLLLTENDPDKRTKFLTQKSAVYTPVHVCNSLIHSFINSAEFVVTVRLLSYQL